MKDLNISNYRQPPRSTMCGPACVKMVCDFLGLEKSFSEIQEMCDYEARGTFESSLVLGLSAAGVQSTMYTVPDGQIIRGSYPKMSKKRVVDNLRKRQQSAKKPEAQRGFKELADVVEQGLIQYMLPTCAMIEQELAKGNPWIVSVKAFYLYDWTNSSKANLLHFVIIQGYDDDSFIINDPSHEEGGVYKVGKDKLLHAMYSADGDAICVEASCVASMV